MSTSCPRRLQKCASSKRKRKRVAAEKRRRKTETPAPSPKKTMPGGKNTYLMAKLEKINSLAKTKLRKTTARALDRTKIKSEAKVVRMMPYVVRPLMTFQPSVRVRPPKAL